IAVPNTTIFSNLMDRLFATQPDAHLDLAFDALARHAPSMVHTRVCEAVAAVFRRHGAVQLDTPLLLPKVRRAPPPPPPPPPPPLGRGAADGGAAGDAAGVGAGLHGHGADAALRPDAAVRALRRAAGHRRAQALLHRARVPQDGERGRPPA